MRRIAPAIGPVLAFVAIAVPASPAHSYVPRAPETRTIQTADRSATDPAPTSRTRIGLDTASLGSRYVQGSWNWIRAASGYQVQVARGRDFSAVVSTQHKRNSARRPAGGRVATTVGHLRDATYYWVRVRKVTATSRAPWSGPVRVATKAAVPDKITTAHAEFGAAPGTTKFHWRSDGGHTDFFKITTALTPFGSKSSPGPGRNQMSFKAAGDLRTLTLTPEQTQAAGAGLGTGNHLFFRITAVRSGEADTATRPYAYLGHTSITGQAATGTGTPLRVGQYNVHVQSHDFPGHPWHDRVALVAANLAAAHPDIVAIEELVPSMWIDPDGGPDLDSALNKVGMGDYQLTRDTVYGNGTAGDARILYDPTKLQMTSTCDPNTVSCVIKVPDGTHTHYVAYARFQDKTGQPGPPGQEFWFVAAHLTHGNDAQSDALRGQQAQTIVEYMNALNAQLPAPLPIIYGADTNSSQTSAGHNAPHQALLDAGYYDTSAAARQIGLRYDSVNGYRDQTTPNGHGFGSMLDNILTWGIPGADLFTQVITGSPYPSDHNLIYTDLHLP
jgi:hypothetical protein